MASGINITKPLCSNLMNSNPRLPAACPSLLAGLTHFNAEKLHVGLYDDRPKGLRQTIESMGLVRQRTYHRIDYARTLHPSLQLQSLYFIHLVAHRTQVGDWSQKLKDGLGLRMAECLR